MRLIFDVTFEDACNSIGQPVASTPDISDPNAPTTGNWRLEIYEKFWYLLLICVT